MLPEGTCRCEAVRVLPREHLLQMGAEAQRGEGACLRQHSKPAAPDSIGIQSCGLLHFFQQMSWNHMEAANNICYVKWKELKKLNKICF